MRVRGMGAKPSEVASPEDDHRVRALPTRGSHDSLDKRTLPGRLRTDWNFLEPDPVRAVTERHAILAGSASGPNALDPVLQSQPDANRLLGTDQAALERFTDGPTGGGGQDPPGVLSADRVFD